MEGRLLKTNEVVKKYGVNRNTVERWRLKGFVRYESKVINGRNCYLYLEDDIENHIKSKS